MSMDSTITEPDMDPASLGIWQGLPGEGHEADPDLAVDGLSESIFGRIFRLLPGRRCRA